jgi:lysophospholipase L1-like esterase
VRIKNALIQNLLLSAFSLVLFFLCLEISTRLFWHGNTQGAHVGVILKGENRQIIHKGIQYKTNSLGLRNKEVQKDKPGGVKRILALGDSFVWGDGLSYDDLVTVKIEKALNNIYSHRIEVINGGISGFNTTDEFKQLKRLGLIYEPDLVVVFFFTNDVLEIIDKEGKKIKGNHASRVQNIKETLRKNSKFFAYLYYLYKNKYASKIGVPQFMLPTDYFNLNDSKPGWLAFKNGIRQMQNYVQQKDIEFIFIMIPTLTTLDKNYPYSELREKVTEFIKFNNIHFIDLFDTFAPYQPLDLWVSKENSHWNGQATTMAANKIMKYIVHGKLLE